ncbi:MAG: arginine deiminase [Prevotellaceae bacterium]|jgi:arginine deiminase|nr:arginine deiminase [Prevotellaceae bacterium]
MASKIQKTTAAAATSLRGSGVMPMAVDVQSEIGELEAVIIHTPGAEVENMTPKHAQRALYSDILNLPLAQREYEQIEAVLSSVARTLQLRDLLVKVLENHSEKAALVEKICRNENVTDYFDDLLNLSPNKLATCLIEGLPARIDNLTAFLNDDYYALFPLYNFYFTRDASMAVGRHVLIGKMANRVRLRESIIMDAIFRNEKLFHTSVINPYDAGARADVLIEGGDVLVAREDVLLVGNGNRTSSQGIDFILNQLCAQREEGRKYVLVQQLPDKPESFIHLDMVFTFLDRDTCMVFEPLILEDNRYETVLITVDNGRVARIKYVPDLLSGLKRLGFDLEPVVCGGREDEWIQEREQWHSGANFFALAPGKVVSYARNIHTIDELAKHGFDVVTAADVVAGKVNLKKVSRCVVTIEGSELPRGGGGARCMTMPLRRKPVVWN